MLSVVRRRPRLWLRGAICVAIGFVLLVGPIVGQVLGVRTARVYPKWRMFTGTGRDICQVEYTRVTEEGTREVLDHHAVLRWPRRASSGRAIGLKRDALPQVHARMCWALGAARQHVDLRVRARCGSRRHWIDHSVEDRSVCRAR